MESKILIFAVISLKKAQYVRILIYDNCYSRFLAGFPRPKN